ncbi:hypothetical protein GCM10020219_088980 [Nonomuraea dietziae]
MAARVAPVREGLHRRPLAEERILGRGDELGEAPEPGAVYPSEAQEGPERFTLSRQDPGR